jgi:outer membrane protein OmpA-like peptidoglycan-associated protein
MTMQVRRLTVALLACAVLAAWPVAAQEVDLLALGEGTLPVVVPPCYGGWPAQLMLDDASTSGWASEKGRTTGNVFVFETPEPVTLSAFEFDTQSIDCDQCGAKDVIVEVSSTSKDGGFQQVLKATLADRKDGQRFTAAQKVKGRWVRLTIANNHGAGTYSELMSFRGFGPRPTELTSLKPIAGTYNTTYSNFHILQEGASISGCYEYHDGLFSGVIEGRVAKLTWSENSGNSKGPAVFVFTPDGKSFKGFWWNDTDKDRPPSGGWVGTRLGDAVGGCPHWSGSVGGEVKRDLVAKGRARLVGILFDSDSAKLKPQSLPALDEVAKILTSEPSWFITIEGHTDSTSTPAHNQTLSEQRAKAVLDYLVSKGVDPKRLTALGFGQSKPVADNATELGRAQNRRVELVKK